MTSQFLLGLDAGGGGGRALLFEIESGRVTTAARAWSHPPAPGVGWGFDLDPERCWALLLEATREAMARAGASPQQVIGLAVTGMRHTAVALDREGRILLATPNRDARAAAEGMSLAAEGGPEFLRRTGHWPSPIFAAARLRWLAANDPAAFARAQTLLSLNEWLAARLCGQLAAEPSQAAETMLLDLTSRDWAWDLIAGLGLPRHIFPPLRRSGERLGELSAQAADALHLRAGVPVAVGGADTQCALLAVGAVAPGDVAAVAGTTTPVQAVTAQPLVDAQARTWTGCHVLPDLWVVESNAGSTGEALEWLAAALYPEAARPVALLCAEATQAPPGAGGILSTFGAAVMHAAQMELPIGNLTGAPMLGAASRADLARAVLEGMACAVRANVEQILSVTGGEFPAAFGLGGGMTRSPAWAQLVSDVLGAPVHAAPTPEASALGAAICAGVAAGVFPSLAAGAAHVARLARRYAPDPARAQDYRQLYAGWRQLRQARAESDQTAAGLALQRMMSASAVAPAPRAADFRPRILVTADVDEASLADLRALGEVEYASYRDALRLLSGPDLADALAGRHIFITEVDVVDAAALAQAEELRAIIVCRGNAVNVDVAACTALGLPVIAAPGRNADAVADLTLAFMLMLARKLPEAISFLYEPGGEAGDMGRQGMAHQALRGHELWGRTVGLIGLGAVGRAVARRLQPFGARVLACDPALGADEAALAGAELVPLETLLAESDFVSLHAAVTEESRGLIGRDALARMKPGAFLINTARAALVDETALVDALRAGRLGGAALDVFSVEPPASDDPLLSLPNVIATPHIGGNTFEVSAHQGRAAIEAVRQLLRGEPPRGLLNPETMAQFRWVGPRTPIAVTTAPAAPPAVSDLQRDARPASAPPPQEGLLGKGLRGLRERLSRKPEPSPAPAAAPPQAQIERLVRAFLARVAEDPALRRFAAGQRVTMHYILRDVGLEFYMSFRDGQVTCGLGAPLEPAEVRLKMKAEVMDGMFTGRINAPKAAMAGQISFSGDARLAMGIQRIQDDLTRLYALAREEVGGPGELTPVPAAPPPSAPAPSDPLREELVRVVRELYAGGLITATGGNVSVRIPGQAQIWITPSQLFKGDLRAEVLVRIDVNDAHGRPLDEDSPSPSSEWPMHCAIYRARPDVGAIIHTHAPYATVLGLSGKPFLPISTESAFLIGPSGDLPRVPFFMPGTPELARAATEALGGGAAVLLVNHGLLVAGSDLRRAANMTEVVERTAEVILRCYALGQPPPTLPADALAALREMGKMMA